MTAAGSLLWTPSPQRVAAARLTRFVDDLVAAGVLSRRPTDHEALWRWSVDELDTFWRAFADWYGVCWGVPPRAAAPAALAAESMPGAQWFPGTTLNYAQHLLFPPGDVAPGAVAVIAVRENPDGHESATLTWEQLREQVASVRSALVRLGVGRGDRVAALLPNGVEAVVAMLATTSLGAIWSSCSPDFGPQAIADRFTQVEPRVLIAVDGYRYGGRAFDVRDVVTALREQLPSLRATVLVPGLDAAATMPDSVRWPELLAAPGELAFEPVPFDAPLWILFSSGTTGLPKPIVHGHGGILLEHVKQLALHLDLGPGDRFCWFSTTGWMMWNLLVSGLAVGSTIVLFDGNPAWPGPDALWRLAGDAAISCFGVSAPFVQASMRAGVRLGDLDLATLRTIGSTGAPLPPEAFGWIYGQLGPDTDVVLNSLSGGTDVCTAFVGGDPTLPVHAGEIAARLLGCAVESFDADGRPVIDEVGELVITRPMPSMPVVFWHDPDGARLREAYFETYPGVWRHGDWLTITARGSCVIHGRSDATLNRGGVRMGTAEFYRVVEAVPGVADSLVVDTSAAGAGRLLLFVVLEPGASRDAVTRAARTRLRAQLSPRHVPDEVIAIDEVPRTLNGKKCEVPVKRVLAGVPVAEAVSEGALKNPGAMTVFTAMAASNTGKAP